MSTGPTYDPGLTAPDRDVVDRSCRRLRLSPLESVERVSVGRSGSLVVRLDVAGKRLILKITTDLARRARARTELARIAHAPDGFAAAMPSYVAGYDDPDAVCLVIHEHQPLPHPSSISADDWSTLATALGHLHRQVMPEWPDLEPAPPPDERTVEIAAQCWAKLGLAEVADRAAELVVRRSSLDAPAVVPIVEHGDCHTENIVRDEAGMFRWLDWQEAHLGDGFGDLAFLWQRAEFAGANPPREAMVATYVASRPLEPGVDVHRALDAAELQLLFISWPPFLDYGTPANRERMLRRLPMIVDALSS